MPLPRGSLNGLFVFAIAMAVAATATGRMAEAVAVGLIPLAAGLVIAVGRAPGCSVGGPPEVLLLVAWTIFGGLLVLSRGFSSIPIPLGPFALPLCQVVFGLVAFRMRKTWLPIVRDAAPGWLAVAALLCIFAAARLLIDYPRFGALAIRDAVPFVDLLALPVGLAVGAATPAPVIRRRIGLILRVAVVWFLFLPFRDALTAAGPTVGVDGQVPLLAFNTAGIVAALALLWFSVERGSSPMLWSGLALFVLAMAQARGQYIGVPLALLVGFLLRGPQRRVGRGVRIVGLVVVVIVALAVGPPLPGRVGDVNLSTLQDQLGTLRGEEAGQGGGSAAVRKDWVPTVLEQVTGDPVKVAFGVGLGPDLLQGYRGPDGELVRKPHNDFLEMFARMGVLGLLAWTALVAIPLLALVRRARSGAVFARWAVEAQVVLLIVALTQPFFAFPYGGISYWFITGLALGCRTPDPRIMQYSDGQHDGGETAFVGRSRSMRSTLGSEVVS